MRALGLLVLGLGAGLGAGVLVAGEGDPPALVWLAAALVVLALAVLAVASRSVPDLIGRPAADPARPTLAGLGERVEKILQLAEEQAADRIRSAEEKAERIVAEARMRAGQPPD